jgi:hypothetical protein
MVMVDKLKMGQRVFVPGSKADLFHNINGQKPDYHFFGQSDCEQGTSKLSSYSGYNCVPTHLLIDVDEPGTKVAYFPLYQASFYALGEIVNGKCARKQTAIKMTGKQYPAKKSYDCVASDKLDPASLQPIEAQLIGPANITRSGVTTDKGDKFSEDRNSLFIQPGLNRTVQDAMNSTKVR